MVYWILSIEVVTKFHQATFLFSCANIFLRLLRLKASTLRPVYKSCMFKLQRTMEEVRWQESHWHTNHRNRFCRYCCWCCIRWTQTHLWIHDIQLLHAGYWSCKLIFILFILSRDHNYTRKNILKNNYGQVQ